MSLLETAMQLASSQSDKIARVIGKRPEEVRGAIQQATRMLPDILNSKDGGISVLNRIGVDKKFMDEMYRKYAPYASKIPGLNKDMVGNTLNAIEKAMDKPTSTQSPKKSGFDPSRYPKL